MKKASGAALIAVLLAGCGGGGDDTAVSATPPAPPVAVAPSPASPPAANPPAAQPPAAQPPAPVPIPIEPPASKPSPQPGQPPAPPSVSGQAVVRALSIAVNKHAVSISKADGHFSSVAHDYNYSTARLTSRSFLTDLYSYLPNDIVEEAREIVLSLTATTNGSSTFTFNGGGSVTTPEGQFALSYSQYTIPASVPLDASLFTIGLPASPSSNIRFFVGSIPAKPEWMRVCWNINAPGVLRVSCSRHDRSTGNVVGVDAVNDLAGNVLQHESADTGSVRWSVLACQNQFWGPDGSATGMIFKTASYDSSKDYGGLVTLPWQYSPITVNSNGNLSSITFSDPLTTYEYTVRDGAEVIGLVSNSQSGSGSNRDTCSLY